MLRLPEKPIKNNNTNLSDKFKELILVKKEKKNPSRKDALVLIIKILNSLVNFLLTSFS